MTSLSHFSGSLSGQFSHRPTQTQRPKLSSPVILKPGMGFVSDMVKTQSLRAPIYKASLISLAELSSDQIFLRLGDQGEAVEKVQSRLIYWGHELKADGIFGADTLQALQDFQKQHGLKSTGHVGGRTLVALNTKKPEKRASGSVTLNLIRENKAYLHNGDRGNAVKQIQTLLHSRGYAVSRDGEYGVETARAVRQFQQDQQIQTNGFVGTQTLAALEDTHSKVNLDSIRSGQSILKSGTKGDSVAYIQRRLSAWGYPVKADGDFGPSTARALRGYQRDHGMAADSVVGKETLRSLDKKPDVSRNTSHKGSAIGRRLAKAAKRVAQKRRTTGWCYAGVAESISRGMGVSLWGRSAYMAARILSRNPKFKEIKVSAKSLPKLPAGAIVVWGKTSVSPHGHISVSLGDGREASDHIARQRTHLRRRTNFRVFLPSH